LKFAALVCRNPPKSKWQAASAQWFATLIRLFRNIIRLPDLPAAIRHRLAVSVPKIRPRIVTRFPFSRRTQYLSAQCESRWKRTVKPVCEGVGT